MYRRQLLATLPLSTRAVVASEPGVLGTHFAIPRACDYSDSVSGCPWCMTAWSGSMRPIMAELSACPTFFRMKLSWSAVILVSPDWAPMASSCISILRCRTTAGSSGRQCVLLARCEHPQLTQRSIDGLVVLFMLQAGAPACYGLRRTSSWCDMMDVFGRKQVADMLLERTLCVFDKRAWQHISDC